ncbi:MAG TPA: DUF952 domain-containing protein [Nakamurella sp.]
MTEPIFHCSLRSDWHAAQAAGEYTISSRGVTLEHEGFIHACYAHQVDGVLRRFYAGVTEPMVLLVIDQDRLGVPVVAESPPGVDELFPHIYGPLDPAAVTRIAPLVRGEDGWIAPTPGA